MTLSHDGALDRLKTTADDLLRMAGYIEVELYKPENYEGLVNRDLVYHIEVRVNAAPSPEIPPSSYKLTISETDNPALMLDPLNYDPDNPISLSWDFEIGIGEDWNFTPVSLKQLLYSVMQNSGVQEYVSAPVEYHLELIEGTKGSEAYWAKVREKLSLIGLDLLQGEMDKESFGIIVAPYYCRNQVDMIRSQLQKLFPVFRGTVQMHINDQNAEAQIVHVI